MTLWDALCHLTRPCFAWLLIKIRERKYIKAGRCLEIIKLTSLLVGSPGAWSSEKWLQGCLTRVVPMPYGRFPAWNSTPWHVEQRGINGLVLYKLSVTLRL